MAEPIIKIHKGYWTARLLEANRRNSQLLAKAVASDWLRIHAQLWGWMKGGEYLGDCDHLLGVRVGGTGFRATYEQPHLFRLY